jgi:hypothetical protein
VEATPHGTEGWLPHAVRRNYATFAVDLPGRGRSGFDSTVISVARTPARLQRALETLLGQSGSLLALPRLAKKGGCWNAIAGVSGLRTVPPYSHKDFHGHHQSPSRPRECAVIGPRRPGVGPAIPNLKSPGGFPFRYIRESVISLISSGCFKHNLIPMRSNHTREASHFITLAC